MVKKFMVLGLLLFFCFSFVSFATAEEVWFNVTKIGFYTSTEEEAPQEQYTVTLPSPVRIHVNIGVQNPGISDFVYAGPIPNGSFIGINVYGTEEGSARPADWITDGFGFDSYREPTTYTFVETDRKLIRMFVSDEDPIATVENL
jgi:hypothetical protein